MFCIKIYEPFMSIHRSVYNGHIIIYRLFDHLQEQYIPMIFEIEI